MSNHQLTLAGRLKSLLGLGLVLTATILCGNQANAQNTQSEEFDHTKPVDLPMPGEDVEEHWRERKTELPPLPAPDALHPVNLTYSETGYNYYIDTNSLSLGDDGIFRYTIVIETPSGARNVLHEGVRCATDEFKTYAYGSRQGKFRPMRSPWKTLRSAPRRGALSFRPLLSEEVLCHHLGGQATVKQVLRQLNDGPDKRPEAGSYRRKEENI